MQIDAKRKGLHQSEALQGNGYEGLQNSKNKHDPGGQHSLETAATAEVVRKLTTLSDRKINDRQGSSQPIKKQKLIPTGDKPATAATIMGYYDEGQGKNKCVIHKIFYYICDATSRCRIGGVNDESKTPSKALPR